MTLNYDDFKTKLNYPSKDSFAVWYFYKSGKLMESVKGEIQLSQSLPEKLKAVRETARFEGWTETKEMNDVEYKKVLSEFGAENRRLEQAFITALREENMEFQMMNLETN